MSTTERGRLAGTRKLWFVGVMTIVGGAAVVLLLLLAGGEGYTLRGALELTGSEEDVRLASGILGADEGDVCSGAGGYGDLTGGAEVVVRNEVGRVLGTGNLTPGTITHYKEDLSGGLTGGFHGELTYTCRFSFTMSDVDDAEFYVVEVGGRGEVRYTKDEMEEADWSVELTIGSGS